MLPTLTTSLAVAAPVACLSWEPLPGLLTVQAGDGITTTLSISGNDILINGQPCDPGATRESVRVIRVIGDESPLSFATALIDQSGGVFTPNTRFEFHSVGALEIIGSEGIDRIQITGDGIHLNGEDSDFDVQSFTSPFFITVDARRSNDVVGADGDAIVGTEGSAHFEITGGTGSDSLGLGGDTTGNLRGGKGDDFLKGGSFGDRLIGGPGADVIDGGAGTDVVDYADAAGPVRVSLLSGTGSATDGVDVLSNLEVIFGSPFADILVGNGGDNFLDGGEGNDTINGHGGDDNIACGFGRDRVSFAGSASRMIIDLAKFKADGWGADLVFGCESAVGSAWDDRVAGTTGRNLLLGGGGNDVILARGGSDVLSGGVGRDRLEGAPGQDWLGGGRGHDMLGGGLHDDVLRGGKGRDRLNGDEGNDVLNGGPGADTCFQDAGVGSQASCE